MPTFGAEAGLAPVRYHIFKTPLAYPLGLELQNGVVQERLKRKREGTGGKTDILFLLGKSGRPPQAGGIPSLLLAWQLLVALLVRSEVRSALPTGRRI